MKVPILLFVAASFALAGCGENSSTSNSASNAAANNTASAADTNQHAGVLTAPVDYLGAVLHGQQTSMKLIDISYLHHAIQMFQIEKGRYPKSLQELLDGKYIGKIPAPPYGFKIVYNPNTGEVSVVKK